MKTRLLVILLLIPLIGYGQGQEKRVLESFSAVEIYGAGNIFFVSGETPGIEISLRNRRSDPGEIQTSIKHGKLVVEPEEYIPNGLKMDLIITYAEPLRDVTLNGSGKVYFDDKLETEAFNLNINGAEVIYLEIDTERLNIELSGAGVIHLTGRADEQRLNIDGAGKIWALEMISQKAWVDLDGAGKIELTAKSEIHVSLSGVGRIEYAGDPEVQRIDKSGLGAIRAY